MLSFLNRVSGKGTQPRAAGARDERLRGAFDVAPIGLGIAALDGHWILFNDACCALLGYTRDELHRVRLNDITHPDDAARELAFIKRVLNGDAQRYRIEKRTIDKSGAYRDVHVTVALARGGESGDSFVYVIEPAHKQVESGRDAEHLAAVVLDRLSETAVIRTDARGAITGWNAGAAAILGYTREQIAGKNRRVLYRDQDNWDDRPGDQLRIAAEQGHCEREEFRVRRDGTHVWLRSSVLPFAPGGIVRGYIEVLTAPANSEPELREALTRTQHELEAERTRAASLKTLAASRARELKLVAIALRREINKRKALESELAASRVSLVNPTPTTVPAPAEPRIAIAMIRPTTLPSPPASAPAAEEIAHLTATGDVILEPERHAWSTLGNRSPLELLGELVEAQRSGLVIFVCGERHTAIHLERGRISSCASNDPASFLAERLVRSQIISEGQRNKALEMAEETDLAFGRVLILLGILTDEQVALAVREKVENEIAALAECRDCRWNFVEKSPPRGKLVSINVDFHELRAVRAQRTRFIASRTGTSYHRAGCISLRKVAASAQLVLAGEDDARRRDLKPCRMCLRPEA
ncbi:MAG: PAS domain S-box protein [Acidobacteria bacterium]|nr:PAS domain S-box protein [Acidobacteriota bacterium]MBV9476625.1 PAS domain S-box protein [Acidobacteriota bacterium]